MAYTAIAEMQKQNKEMYGVNFPKQPDPIHVTASQGDMEQAALFFLHDRCEGLRFDEKIAHREMETGNLEGTSAKKGQIPYNMEMDIDRRCFEYAIHRFMKSGTAEDAFDVYVCYLKMFLGSYKTSKRMIELLSEFEANASALLMKHRDHYSHSVYVFVLGLSIYESNEYYRGVYKEFYGVADDKLAAHHFLEYWGLASLFHDIGYPFELPFEQVKAYFAETEKNLNISSAPYVAYTNMKVFNSLTDNEKISIRKLDNSVYAQAETIYEVLAANICCRLGDEYKLTQDKIQMDLKDKPEHPEKFGNFMDHAFFSSTVLFKKLVEELGKPLNETHIDVLTAIVLHNSLFKFKVMDNYKKDNHPLNAEKHPLAYMLMLCDELQCWNRTSYGRNSRSETHPMWCDFSFSKDEIIATYIFDEEEKPKIEQYEKGARTTLKAYSGMKKGDFLNDIQKIIKLDKLSLKIKLSVKRASANRTTNLSSSNFLHLHNFAVALNGRYNGDLNKVGLTDEVIAGLEKDFENLSLEYQLSNVAQAKKFADYLHKIGCFYTDRPVNLNMITEFTPEHMDIIGPMEHDRWDNEKKFMGWAYGNAYEELSQDKGERKILREQFRINNVISVEYDDLSEEEQGKDIKPMQLMLKLIKQFDGLRIYYLV